jgi:hypothetical protein
MWFFFEMQESGQKGDLGSEVALFVLRESSFGEGKRSIPSAPSKTKKRDCTHIKSVSSVLIYQIINEQQTKILFDDVALLS